MLDGQRRGVTNGHGPRLWKTLNQAVFDMRESYRDLSQHCSELRDLLLIEHLEDERIGGSVGLPAVVVVDEFEGDDQGDGEGELGLAVLGSAVGVASELPVAGEP